MKNIRYNLAQNKHIKPVNLKQLGYFLAGLIDADGHIHVKGHITIDSHIRVHFVDQRDLGTIYYIKKVLGGGNIYKYKKVKACRYTTSKQSFVKLTHLIMNKLRLIQKINQLNQRLPHVSHLYNVNSNPISMNNHWFAGFVMGDGCLSTLWTKGQIKIRKPGKLGWSRQVELVLGIELKQKYLLEQIQTTFGCWLP